MNPTNGYLSDLTIDALTWGARTLGRVGPVRRALAGHVERRLRTRTHGPAAKVRRHPLAVEHDKVALGLALLATAERGLARGTLGSPALRALLRNLYADVFVKRGGTTAKDRFRARHGQTPPDFLTISPGRGCNLSCTGCYANSGTHKERLDWTTFERIVSDAHRDWGMRVFVISGGEPLAYRGEGKGVLDLAERFPDCFFVMYTNGTLVDARTARRLGRLGNLSPCLSVEGLREKTDARRGAGVFDKVLAAMERLQGEGVLFAVSMTATRDNAEEILSDEAVGTFFEELGAHYAFIFHYMPIGRAFSLDLMMTPGQRFRLYERVWQLIRERHIFIADFWNGATASNGCLAAGRAGGYFHVNWNGDMSPCVFLPYAPCNLKDVFAAGGSLDDAWADPFFADIRKWQREYGYREATEPGSASCGNWIAPCLIRDHHRDFMRIMAGHHARPTDDDAREALRDPAYHEGLERFDREYAALADPAWDERYRRSPGVAAGPMERR